MDSNPPEAHATLRHVRQELAVLQLELAAHHEEVRILHANRLAIPASLADRVTQLIDTGVRLQRDIAALHV